jgi:hypothetical protein
MTNMGYNQLKSIFNGETPFIVSRHPAGAKLAPFACNAFPECDVTPEHLTEKTGTLEELMQARCDAVFKQFEKEAPQSMLHVWWSGGLDSTSILACMHRDARFHELVEAGKLVIVCDENSIREYPAYYERVVSKLPTVTSDLALYMKPYSYHVDGMFADELFGNYQAEQYPDGALSPASSLEDQIMRSTSSPDAILYFLSEAAELEAAFPSKTVFQRLWWLEFNLSFQDANLRPYYNGSNNADARVTASRFKAQSEYRWFSHPSWTAWAIQRQLDNTFGSYRESKQELRDFILSCTHDEEYVRQKEKEYSQGKMYFKWKHGIAANFCPF